MAAGIPVVATAVGGNPEAIVHGVTGYLVKDRNVAEFAQQIVGLLWGEDNRRVMGQRAHARRRELFDVQEMVRGHERYWAQLIRRKPAISSQTAGAGT
jgi:glycosyltransferase involved in cell wall biosynthesis